MRIGNREFDVAGHTYIMGILNVTPDSFSDGGRYNTRERAKYRIEQMIEEGADIIDVGGESTRPGYTKISEEEELEHVIPVIQMIREQFDIPISIDTYKSAVALEAIREGADLVNDIWGLKYDSKMAGLIARTGASCCLMHNRAVAQYQDFMNETIADLAESVRLAGMAGIAKNRIILDPGVGFAKNNRQNLEIIRSLEAFHQLGYPLLLGASRKSVIGNVLKLPVTERVEGTIVTTVLAVLKHCAFVRVHDIKENRRAIRMTEEIIRG